jgi:hypothetical protein
MRVAIPPLPQYTFLAWCSLKEAQDNFTFTFTNVPHPETDSVWVQYFALHCTAFLKLIFVRLIFGI